MPDRWRSVGVVRERLARRLMDALPQVDFTPEQLHRHSPSVAQRNAGACSWFGFGTDRATGRTICVISWNRMRACTDRGFDVRPYPIDGPDSFEIVAREKGTGR